MTRYARAKGSKASNERLPDEATPWHVMKQQLEETSESKKESSKIKQSAKELLASKEEPFYYENVGNTNNDWAVFENQPSKKQQKQKNDKKEIIKQHSTNDTETEISAKKSKKKKKEKSANSEPKEGNDETEPKHSKMKKKKKKDSLIEDSKKPIVQSEKIPKMKETINSNQNMNTSLKKKRKNTENEDIKSKKIKQDHSDDLSNQKNSETMNENGKSVFNGMSKRQKRNINRKMRNKCETNPNHKKPPKMRDDKEHKKRKPDAGDFKMQINGVEVEITKFDGFPVKKEDAERLRELRKQMIMKGIPKSDINVAMKLERRKAERALSRLRKCVCFHCRKAGHNLSDCPELGEEQAATGICFKCGSTEHTHFECKVTKVSEFRYATCFICREQGHIAKQCPDNPRGVYPQGGCCKICGDVTHLKKDCPDLVKEKEENVVTADTINDSTLESLEGDEGKIEVKREKKPVSKIVKF